MEPYERLQVRGVQSGGISPNSSINGFVQITRGRKCIVVRDVDPITTRVPHNSKSQSPERSTLWSDVITFVLQLRLQTNKQHYVYFNQKTYLVRVFRYNGQVPYLGYYQSVSFEIKAKSLTQTKSHDKLHVKIKVQKINSQGGSTITEGVRVETQKGGRDLSNRRILDL